VLVFGEIGYIFNLIFAFPIFNALMVLYHLFGDFGLSIVLLTLIIRLILFPLTLKQLKSMKAMQALQPHLADIKKKYAKDQQAQLMATQALYKEHGINPAAGCLPMLIQLPVLYGLFYGIEDLIKVTNVHALNNLLYPFIPHFAVMPNLNLTWLTFINPAWQFSLAQPDPTFILPILAGLATFVYMRMSVPKNTPKGTNDPTAQTQKMMQYMMPLITVFFAWRFAAALALYWTVSSIFQAVQQYFVTGWGSLAVTPDFLHHELSRQVSTNTRETSSRSYTGDQRKEREIQEQADEEEPRQEQKAGSAASKPRPNPRSSGGGSAQYARRKRGSSASARRRSSTQRSRS
jgi:YidC/Oxa1 family membrane protein insertase